MAESSRELRGPDPSSGMAANPGAAPLRVPRDPRGEESDSDSDTLNSSAVPSEEEEEGEEGLQWRVGDACSVAWPRDGRLYRARVRALDRAAGTCLVQFEGSGHTEQRALAELLPATAAAWRVPPAWQLPPGMRRRRRRKDERAPGSPWPPEEEEEEEEEENALTAMLMAWYLSGYHTGFYVGLQDSRAEAAEYPPGPGHRQQQPPCY